VAFSFIDIHGLRSSKPRHCPFQYLLQGWLSPSRRQGISAAIAVCSWRSVSSRFSPNSCRVSAWNKSLIALKIRRRSKPRSRRPSSWSRPTSPFLIPEAAFDSPAREGDLPQRLRGSLGGRFYGRSPRHAVGVPRGAEDVQAALQRGSRWVVVNRSTTGRLPLPLKPSSRRCQLRTTTREGRGMERRLYPKIRRIITYGELALRSLAINSRSVGSVIFRESPDRRACCMASRNLDSWPAA
jgi:hypothetical protein